MTLKHRFCRLHPVHPSPEDYSLHELWIHNYSQTPLTVQQFLNIHIPLGFDPDRHEYFDGLHTTFAEFAALNNWWE